MASQSKYNRQNYLKNREARLAAQKAYYWANKESRNAYNKEYTKVNAGAIAARRKAHREATSEEQKARNKAWYERNADYAKAKSKEYREVNKATLLEQSKRYRKIRETNDPVFKLARRVRTLIYIKIRSGGYTKRSKTHAILGCSFSELMTHISQQFTNGMSWENYGDWHIDHITPIASAKTEEDVIRLNHYTNLQPLWALDNLVKGCKV